MPIRPDVSTTYIREEGKLETRSFVTAARVKFDRAMRGDELERVASSGEASGSRRRVDGYIHKNSQSRSSIGCRNVRACVVGEARCTVSKTKDGGAGRTHRENTRTILEVVRGSSENEFFSTYTPPSAAKLIDILIDGWRKMAGMAARMGRGSVIS
ncbi:hypothetical protein K439DRAFT_1620683 [Ramaria rubella]|nr:hypothetical protein K439DRAFT_1620683 [Ramaria rubella]